MVLAITRKSIVGFFIIFCRNITEKVTCKQSKDAIFFHLTQLMLLHYQAKLKTRKLYLVTKMFHVDLPVHTSHIGIIT